MMIGCVIISNLREFYNLLYERTNYGSKLKGDVVMRLVPVDQVDPIATTRGYKKTKNYYVMEEFVNSDMKVALLEDYPQKNPRSVQSALAYAAKRFGFNVKVMVRGKKVFLVKVNPDED